MVQGRIFIARLISPCHTDPSETAPLTPCHQMLREGTLILILALVKPRQEGQYTAPAPLNNMFKTLNK